MQHNSIVMEIQKRFNNAFKSWTNSGFPQGGQDWDTMFQCVSIACSNVAKSMVKHFIPDIEDKAMDCTIHIMESDILKKHIQIDSLGAYVRYPLMNYLWHASVIRRDRQQSYEDLQDIMLQAEETQEEGEQLVWVPDVGFVKKENLKENKDVSTAIFLKDWFS